MCSETRGHEIRVMSELKLGANERKPENAQSYGAPLTRVRIAFSAEIVDRVCDLLEQGKSLRDIGRIPGMPNRATLWKWCDKYPEVAADIARARDLGFDECADRAVEEARAATDAAKGRLVFDAERWRLSKLNPERYGERLRSEISGPNGKPISGDPAISDQDMLERLQRIFAAAQARRVAEQRLALVNEKMATGSDEPSAV